jgi:hypothetical protein
MAIVTHPKGEYVEYAADGVTVLGRCVVEYDYDNVTMKLQTGRVINGTSRPVHIDLVRTLDQLTIGLDVAAGQTRTQAIPASGAASWGLTVLPSGKLDGCGVNIVPQ